MKRQMPVVESCLLIYALNTRGNWLYQSVASAERYTLNILSISLFLVAWRVLLAFMYLLLVAPSIFPALWRSHQPGHHPTIASTSCRWLCHLRSPWLVEDPKHLCIDNDHDLPRPSCCQKSSDWTWWCLKYYISQLQISDSFVALFDGLQLLLL